LDHKAHTGQPNSKPIGRGRPSAPLPLKPAPSNVLSKLASLSNQSQDISPTDGITRSSAFAEKPVPQPDLNADASLRRPDDVIDAPARDNRLALIEDLEMGPIDHKPPFDDPHFQQLEPYSGIRLSWVFK